MSPTVASVVSTIVEQAPPKIVVNREKTTPFLMRVFTKIGSHHRADEFSLGNRNPKGEIQIHTWKDATLREITNLIKEVNTHARYPNVILSFAFVYPDKRGNMVLREIGKVGSVRKGDDDEKTLDLLRFEAGDYLDIAMLG